MKREIMHESLLQLISLQGRVACVTGAGRGIGRAIAERLAQGGAAVMLTDVDPSHLDEAMQAIVGSGGRAQSLVANAGSVDDAQRVMSQVVDRFGRLDILVNNAAIFPVAQAIDVSEALWDRVCTVDLKGVYFHMQAAAQRMISAKRGGRIINISSQSTVIPALGMSTYLMCKGGVDAVTRGFAKELGPHGITVNAVSPGTIITPGSEQTRATMRAAGSYAPEAAPPRAALGRAGRPEDIANTAYFLACDLAAYITGQIVAVDGGYAIM
jgi:NAD(P)-dependent dehydrogenase (short-subunit alcohol dehydrogenase family)